MAEKMPQTLENHAKIDPPFHRFLIPMMLLTIGVSIWNAYQNFTFISAFLILLALTATVAVFLIRIYALKVQNRLIRLEERLRLRELLTEPLRSRIPELTELQLVALRFAGDAEIPALVEKTLDQKLAPKDIKQAIKNWRPDYYRV